MSRILACLILGIGINANAALTSGDTPASSAKSDVGCTKPAGAMVKACNELSEAMNDSCDKELFEQFRQEASSGQVKDADKFCPTQTTVAREDQSFKVAMLEMFGGLVTKESNGKPDAANTASPNGTAKGLCQLDAKSVQAYKCCKGVSDSALVTGPANAKCCVGLNLENMVKGHCYASGGGSDAASCGMAKFQQPLRDKNPKDAKNKDDIAQATKTACEQPKQIEAKQQAAGVTTK